MAQAALNNNAHTRLFIPQFDTDITQAFSEVQSDIEQVLTGRVTHHRGIKWTLCNSSICEMDSIIAIALQKI